MNIPISDHHQTLAEKQAIAAGFTNVAEYLETMIEWAEVQVEDETEILAAVTEGLADVVAGRVRPIRTALADLARNITFLPPPRTDRWPPRSISTLRGQE